MCKFVQANMGTAVVQQRISGYPPLLSAASPSPSDASTSSDHVSVLYQLQHRVSLRYHISAQTCMLNSIPSATLHHRSRCRQSLRWSLGLEAPDLSVEWTLRGVPAVPIHIILPTLAQAMPASASETVPQEGITGRDRRSATLKQWGPGQFHRAAVTQPECGRVE